MLFMENWSPASVIGNDASTAVCGTQPSCANKSHIKPTFGSSVRVSLEWPSGPRSSIIDTPGQPTRTSSRSVTPTRSNRSGTTCSLAR